MDGRVKIAALTLTLLLALAPVAGARMNPVMLGGGNYDDSSITYYFNCDSAVSGQSPTIGNGTVTIGSGVLTVAGAVGNGLSTPTATWGNGRVSFPISGNLSTSTGTLGFYINRNNDTGALLVNIDESFVFYWGYSSAYIFRYKSTTVTVWLDDPVATYFVELAWDDPGGRMAARVNGGSWVENTSVTGNLPSGTALGFLTNSGITFSGMMDQIIISSAYQDDLYSVSTATAF